MRSVDIESEHIASLMQPYRFEAPASIHIFLKEEGSISGCGKWANMGPDFDKIFHRHTGTFFLGGGWGEFA